MAASEAVSKKSECPTLEITRQDFFQEAQALIAQHNEKINEGKIQGPSINVFRNKHQKPKSGKFLPLEIKKKEMLDVIQEFQTAHKNLCFLKESKELSKKERIEESSRKISFKEPSIFNVKEKGKESIDQILKEQVKLGEILTDIEAVSKKMEKGKHHHLLKPRILDSHLSPSLQSIKICSRRLLRGKDRAVCDWRGISSRSSRSTPDSDRLAFSRSSSVFRDKSFLKRDLQPDKPILKPRPRGKSVPSKVDKIDNKVKRIGPHLDIFQVFWEKSKVRINKKTVKLITTMQAFVRGWLERKRFRRLMIKALYHGPNLKAVIKMYCKLIHRVKHRLGLWRTRQIICLPELEEWMDRKKYYEVMFAKREEWQGIERNELLKYFNDCGHFPTQEQIDDIFHLVHSENLEQLPDNITKPKAIEMLFTLYPPQGAHVHDNTKRLKSTWLRPIVNGEEGYKYIVNGHPVLKRANIRIVGKLVARSMRERKMRQRYLL
ncbi:IQ domain-containing protein M isoform X2 [Talpa occidentalis]|uniref:IQ domain-containing protein M isoform X2 n=1 Tax=Talpa occidentalis TaxID=50954 RepID=UPI00188FBAC8|nr:IQ domain-containing protein M isoform X2 [Talpa occidentalis]